MAANLMATGDQVLHLINRHEAVPWLRLPSWQQRLRTPDPVSSEGRFPRLGALQRLRHIHRPVQTLTARAAPHL